MVRLFPQIVSLFAIFATASIGLTEELTADVLRDRIALAEKRVAFEKARLNAVSFDVQCAESRLADAMKRFRIADVNDEEAERRYIVALRSTRLPENIDRRELSRICLVTHLSVMLWRSNVETAKAKIVLDVARQELALAQLEDAELRLQQLRKRLDRVAPK